MMIQIGYQKKTCQNIGSDHCAFLQKAAAANRFLCPFCILQCILCTVVYQYFFPLNCSKLADAYGYLFFGTVYILLLYTVVTRVVQVLFEYCILSAQSKLTVKTNKTVSLSYAFVVHGLL